MVWLLALRPGSMVYFALNREKINWPDPGSKTTEQSGLEPPSCSVEPKAIYTPHDLI